MGQGGGLGRASDNPKSDRAGTRSHHGRSARHPIISFTWGNNGLVLLCIGSRDEHLGWYRRGTLGGRVVAE